MKFGISRIDNTDVPHIHTEKVIEVEVEVTRVRGNQIGSIRILSVECEIPACDCWVKLYDHEMNEYPTQVYNDAVKIVEDYLKKTDCDYEGQVQ